MNGEGFAFFNWHIFKFPDYPACDLFNRGCFKIWCEMQTEARLFKRISN